MACRRNETYVEGEVMFLRWYQANSASASQLERMDIQCFDMPWDGATWGELTKDYHVRVATTQDSTRIAFWIGMLEVNKDAEQYSKLNVLKLGVVPDARNVGVSYAVLRDIKAFADSVGRSTQIRLQVPECLLYPNWQDCFIGGWLKKMNFKTAEPLMTDYDHSLYGVNFHHSYNFELDREISRALFNFHA